MKYQPWKKAPEKVSIIHKLYSSTGIAWIIQHTHIPEKHSCTDDDDDDNDNDDNVDVWQKLQHWSISECDASQIPRQSDFPILNCPTSKEVCYIVQKNCPTLFKKLPKAQPTQGIEYIEYSFNTFWAKQKLQQALKSWSNFSLVWFENLEIFMYQFWQNYVIS